MRIGSNPEKIKDNKNILKPHRVVVVFYIPDSQEEYFKELDLILDKCLKSLIKTINFDTTNITLINNKSSEKVNQVVNKYLPFIDKYVFYNENKGKVYAVLNEVRAVFEPFVTITDADVLFYSGWEKAVFDVFKEVPNTGVVSPMPLPYLTFHYNQSIFSNTLFNKIKFGKYVHDDDVDLYAIGTGLPKIIERNKYKHNWKEKQYILNDRFIIGAYHVVSTYRVEQFREIYDFPNLKFKNSYESDFIDNLADKKGLYRLSTVKTYAYHIGNQLDEVVHQHTYDDSLIINSKDFKGIKPYKKQAKCIIFVKRIIGRIFIKYKWNRKS